MNQNDLNGMTVNERLFHLNLRDEFDNSIKAKDGKLAVEILQKAQFSNEQALGTVNAIFKDPEKYGYR